MSDEEVTGTSDGDYNETLAVRLEEVADLTAELRYSPEPGWRALRAHLNEQGLDTGSCAIGELYPDDYRTLNVTVVTAAHHVLECDVSTFVPDELDWPHGRVEIGKVRQLSEDVWQLADTVEIWAARRFLEEESGRG